MTLGFKIGAVILALCAANATKADEQASLPFSKAVRVGDMLYLSGELGAKPGTMKLVPGGIGPETRQTMDNIRATLEANGSDMDHVVRCLVMLADIKEWGAMNDVYRTYFQAGRFPARSAMGASGLALGARVEIECTARVKEADEISVYHAWSAKMARFRSQSKCSSAKARYAGSSWQTWRPYLPPRRHRLPPHHIAIF